MVPIRFSGTGMMADSGFPAPNPFSRGLPGTLVFFALVLAFIPIQYSGNDEVNFAWILNGGDGFPPDDFLLFTSHFLNRILFFLYGVAPAFPWWGTLITASVFLAAVLFTGVLLRLGKRALPVWPAAIYFTFHCLAFNGITTATLMLELSALLCLFELALRRKIPFARPRWYLALVGSGLGLSLLMRWEAALVFFALSLPLLFVLSKPVAVKIITVLLLAGSVLTLDRVVFRNLAGDAEREFAAYNRLRAEFHDTRAGDYRESVTPLALEKAGWGPEDYRHFQDWIVFDETLFNFESLRIFLEANKSGTTPEEFASFVLRNLRREWKLVALLVLAMTGLMAGWYRHRPDSTGRRLAPYLTPLAAWAAIPCFMATRFVPWVYVPLFLFALGSTLLVMRDTASGEKPAAGGRLGNNAFWALMGLQLLVASALCGRAIFDLVQRRKENRFMAMCMSEAAVKTPVRILVELHPSTGIGLEKIHALSEKLLPAGMSYFPGGWTVHSPRYRRILRQLGYENGGHFLRGLIGNRTVGLILQAREKNPVPGILAGWEEYYARHLSEFPVKLVPVHSCGETDLNFIGLYRVSRAEEAADLTSSPPSYSTKHFPRPPLPPPD